MDVIAAKIIRKHTRAMDYGVGRGTTKISHIVLTIGRVREFDIFKYSV